MCVFSLTVAPCVQHYLVNPGVAEKPVTYMKYSIRILDSHFAIGHLHRIIIESYAAYLYTLFAALVVYSMGHCCALFEVTRHRIENLNSSLPKKKFSNNRLLRKIQAKNLKKLKGIIQMHQSALEFAAMLKKGIMIPALMFTLVSIPLARFLMLQVTFFVAIKKYYWFISLPFSSRY